MIGFKSLKRLGIVFCFLVATPRFLAAECRTVPGEFPLKVHLRCSSGSEFKIVAATSNEAATAKIRLPAPFGTAEFTGVYLQPGKVVKLIGIRKRDHAPKEIEQELYAFLKGREVVWVAVARSSRGYTEVLHNLRGTIQTERIRGHLELPIPGHLKVVEQRLEVPAPEDTYRRMGL